jgi:type II secretory pathway pseudopilin PulG
MVHTSDRGFSLMEVMVVTSILIALAAILLPVYRSARAQAWIMVSKSNLKQIHAQTALYQTDWDGDGVYGTSYAMGLPPWPKSDKLSTLRTLRPPRAPHPASPILGVLYYVMYSEPGKDGSSPLWEQYSQTYQDRSLLYCDPFNNDGRVAIDRGNHLTRYVFGINLGGSIVERRRQGDWMMRSWWHNE